MSFEAGSKVLELAFHSVSRAEQLALLGTTLTVHSAQTVLYSLNSFSARHGFLFDISKARAFLLRARLIRSIETLSN